jgi:hypothetical protein
MKKLRIAATTLLVSWSVIGLSPAFAQNQWGLLTGAQMQAYHACLFEAWIQDYCRWNSPSYARAQCLAANGAGRYPLEGHWVSDSYCWSAAQGLTPR